VKTLVSQRIAAGSGANLHPQVGATLGFSQKKAPMRWGPVSGFVSVLNV